MTVKISSGFWNGYTGEVIEQYGNTVIVELDGREGDTVKVSMNEVELI